MPGDTERLIQTPHGTVTLSRVVPFGGFPHFDSSMIEDYVEALIARHAPHMREDATGTAAMARSLEFQFQKVYEIEFPGLRATDFIPLNTEVPPGYNSYTYTMLQRHGVARIINGSFSADLPNASISGKQWPSPIVTLGMSYETDVLTNQRAGITGVPVENMLARAARFAIEFLGEQIACVGSANDGVPGLTNAPGVAATTQVSTGTWIAQLASIATGTASYVVAQAIASDVNAMVNGISNATNDLYTPDTVLLPVSIYNALRSAPRSPQFSEDTMLDFLEKITGVNIDKWVQLNHAGAGGHGRVMCYKKDPDVLQLIRPLPFTQLAPQPRNLAMTVPCYSQEGGVMVQRPAAVTYMDNLDAA